MIGKTIRRTFSMSKKFTKEEVSKLNVIHDQNEQKFYIQLTEKDNAYIKYRKLDEKTFELKSTVVPREFEGQGIAGKLADETFKFGKENSKKFVISCSYLDNFVGKRPEYQDLIED